MSPGAAWARLPGVARWRAWPAARRRRLSATAALVVGLAFPFVGPNAGHVDAAANAFTYVLLALGLNIVVGFAGLLDLGYAAFFAIGAYGYGVAASAQLQLPWSDAWQPLAWLGQVVRVPGDGGDLVRLQFSFWGMLLVGALVCAVFGVLFGAPTLRLRGDYLAIVTLGFGEIVPVVARNWEWLTNGAQGLGGIRTPRLFGVDFGYVPLPYYFLGLALVAAVVFVSWRLQESRVGRAWMAIREDELAAGAMGVNHVHYKLLAFAMGAAIAGLGGVFYVAKLTTATPEMFQFPVSVMVLVMVVLGGMGSVRGVVLAALIISFLQSVILQELTLWVNALGRAIGSGWLARIQLITSLELIFGVILVLMMLFRREGLFPAARRVSALSREQQAAAPSRGVQVQLSWAVSRPPTLAPGHPLLEIEGLTKRFGGVAAADGIALAVGVGELVSVIGPNGSGKTTLFNLITGLTAPDSGTIRLEGHQIAGLPPHEIVARGIGRTFQNIRLFNHLSVLENLLVGEHTRLSAGALGAILRPPGVRAEERRAVESALEVLALFGNRLVPRLDHPVFGLSYANRRRTEISRAIVTRPKLLLLDEPAAGMNPAETLELMDLIKALRGLGITIVLIEHKLDVVMDVSDRVIVLDHGVKIAEGRPAQVRNDERVIEAYLGRRRRVA